MQGASLRAPAATLGTGSYLGYRLRIFYTFIKKKPKQKQYNRSTTYSTFERVEKCVALFYPPKHFFKITSLSLCVCVCPSFSLSLSRAEPPANHPHQAGFAVPGLLPPPPSPPLAPPLSPAPPQRNGASRTARPAATPPSSTPCGFVRSK